jgi:hypothetical protein
MNPDPSNMKQDCPNQRECLEMLQLILDGEATSDQKKSFSESAPGGVHALLQKLSPGSSDPATAQSKVLP